MTVRIKTLNQGDQEAVGALPGDHGWPGLTALGKVSRVSMRRPPLSLPRPWHLMQLALKSVDSLRKRLIGGGAAACFRRGCAARPEPPTAPSRRTNAVFANSGADQASCIKCHGRGKDKGGLRIDTAGDLAQGR